MDASVRERIGKPIFVQRTERDREEEQDFIETPELVLGPTATH
jgi:hypothetical protein